MNLKTKSKPAASRVAFHAYTENSSRAGYNRKTTSFNMFKPGLMFSHGWAPSCWRALMRRGWPEVRLAPSMTWCSRRPLPLFFSMDFYEREELERGVLGAPCQLCTSPGSKPREQGRIRIALEAWCQLCTSDAAKPRELDKATSSCARWPALVVRSELALLA